MLQFNLFDQLLFDELHEWVQLQAVQDEISQLLERNLLFIRLHILLQNEDPDEVAMQFHNWER